MHDFCFTIFHYSPHGIHKIKKLCKEWDQITYLVYGKEKCNDGKPHLQGYVQFKRAPAKSWQTFNKRLKYKEENKDSGEWAHCIDPYKNGTAEQSAGYCKKGIGKKPAEGYQVYFHEPHDTWDGFEYGTLVPRTSQGSRTDLDEYRTQILEGKRTVDEIKAEEPFIYHQYGRTLSDLQDMYNRKQYRTKKTKMIWLFGKKGTGKTHYWKKDYNPETDYILNVNDGGFWCGYRGQKRVIINEFRGGLPFKDLLELGDDCPYFVKGDKGGNPLPFTSEEVIITSSLPPTMVYNNLTADDKIDQLLDRIELVWLKGESRRDKDRLNKNLKLLEDYASSGASL